MALVVKDRVQETTTTTGTGTITLAGAVTGFQSFSVIGNANTTYYTIAAGSQWEVGIGTYTASGTTLSRDTVLESSNAGSLVDFSAGTKSVFVTYPAEKSLYLDASNNAIGLGTVATTTTLTNATGLPLTTGVTGTLPVTNGGTGVATLTTAYGVLAAGTTATGALQNIGTGTAAQVLTSNGAGALPTFQNASSGVTITNDTTTATSLYPTFTSATSGSVAGLNVTSTKFTFVPTTGTFTVPNVEASNGMLVNSNTVSTSYSIPSGSSALAAGPITVSSGVVVTVPSGSRWVVL
jgi:hypothetical protein